MRDAGLDGADTAVHIVAGQLAGMHGVLAGDQIDVRIERVGEPIGDRRLELQHREARAVGHDFDLDVSLPRSAWTFLALSSARLHFAGSASLTWKITRCFPELCRARAGAAAVATANNAMKGRRFMGTF